MAKGNNPKSRKFKQKAPEQAILFQRLFKSKNPQQQITQAAASILFPDGMKNSLCQGRSDLWKRS